MQRQELWRGTWCRRDEDVMRLDDRVYAGPREAWVVGGFP